jgi:hypothetical protein
MKIPIMVSYAYINQMYDVLMQYRDQIVIYLDSGIFSAIRSGHVFDIGEYCKFLKESRLRPEYYFTMDAPGDNAKTIQQYEMILRQGLNPIFILVREGDPAYFKKLLLNGKKCAIAGLSHATTPKQYLKYLYNNIPELTHRSRQVHWLGFYNIDFVLNYKPGSVDSSSLSNIPARTGRIHVGERNTAHFTKMLTLGNVHKLSKILKANQIKTSDFSSRIQNKISPSTEIISFRETLRLISKLKKEVNTDFCQVFSDPRTFKAFMSQTKKEPL